MLLTKEVEIKVHCNMVKYYQSKGYSCKHRSEIKVKVEDLKPNSNAEVDVLCDYCGTEIYNVKYCTYNRVVNNTGSYVCEKCAALKRENTMLKKYGVKNACYLEEVKDKKKNTSLEKYGVEFVFQCDEVKEKIKATNIERYGTSNASQNAEIKNKIEMSNIEKYGYKNPMSSQVVQQKLKQTMLDKYGVENPMQNKAIRDKASDTCFKKYGVKNPSQSPQIRQIVSKTFYKNNTQSTSSQQVYLHNLYGGELNYPISHFNTDICLLEEQICIEYDGGGHMLSVTTGKVTLEEYNNKTLIRDKIIKQAGYKQIRIISSKDYLPSDEILLQMLEQAKEYFNTTNHTWVEYNIDTSLMRNAEHKEGVFFNFGNLRKIKKVV